MIDAINVITFGAFFVFLLVGTSSTLARVAYYRAHRFRRPRLLVRDVNMISGFAASFGLILIARALRSAGADVSGLATNPLWLLATAGPAVWAVLVYCYFELFVIERGHDEVRDDAYFHPERPADDA